MKRVLLSAFACSPYEGTEPGNGWNWAMHLAERSMDVRVLTDLSSQGHIEEYCRAHPEIKVRFTFFEGGASWLRIPIGLRYALWQWKAVKEARKLLRSENYDIVHHVTYGSITVPSQLWRLNIPVVFGPVGGGQASPPCMIDYFGRKKWLEQLRTFIARALPFSPLHRHWIRKMNIVLATNRDTLEVFRSLGRPDTLLSFDTALPETFFASKPRTYSATDEPLRLLWVGRLLPRKAIPLTLDILAKVTIPSTLTIVGNGLEEQVLRNMIQVRGLEARVFWKPERIPWHEVRQAYGNHDALLFTSVRDSCAAQLLEAMAMGLPVITLGIHGGQDLVPDEAGFKIPVLTKEQVIRDASAAVTEFASMSPQARSKMALAGWAFARTLTWRNRAAFAEKLYERALNQDAGHISTPI